MESLRWSVVGIGIAGRARCRAILETERNELVAVWNGRFAAEAGVRVAATFDDAVACADAVAICSPTEHHGAQVEAVLRARRHCLVEFPLARTEGVARALFDLADEVGRALHVEHIELLEPAGRTLAGSVHPEIVQRIEVSFERPGPADAGPPALALANVARLHRLCAIAGPVRSISRVEVSPGELVAELELSSGAPASVRVAQSPYVQRRTRVAVQTPANRWEQIDGELFRDGQALSLLGVRSLFGRDQALATGVILDGAAPYVSRERILHVLRVTERVGRGQLGAIDGSG